MKRTPLTDIEQSIAHKLGGASFPPATASKRFARDLSSGYVKELSDKGRAFLAYVVNRYRRQYRLSAEEQMWVNEWLGWKPEPSPVVPVIEIVAAPEPASPQEAFEFIGVSA